MINTPHTMETVTFRLNENVTREEFTAAAREATETIRTFDGFVARRLSVSDEGLWIEQIEWRTLDDAKAAAARIGSETALRPFLSAIDGPSATMHHSTLEVSAG